MGERVPRSKVSNSIDWIWNLPIYSANIGSAIPLMLEQIACTFKKLMSKYNNQQKSINRDVHCKMWNHLIKTRPHAFKELVQPIYLCNLNTLSDNVRNQETGKTETNKRTPPQFSNPIKIRVLNPQWNFRNNFFQRIWI